MRVSHIAPWSTDYDVDGLVYESPVYDVYDNDNYKNYCTTKTRYGLDLVGDGTWTGLNKLSDTESESGYIDDTDRFIDTSARVIVALPILEIHESAKANGVTGLVTVYSSDVEEYPEDWVPFAEVESGAEFGLTKSDRYVRFVVTLSNPNGYTITDAPFDLAVRVEIDKPVMSPLYERTRIALDKLPEWMAMREIDNTPEVFGLATPETVGGKFANAIMGEWLDKIASDLSYFNLQLFIDSVDLNQPDWVREWNLSPEDVDIDWFSRIVETSSGIELAQACDLEEFYAADADADIYIWLESQRKIFTRKTYEGLTAYQGAYTTRDLEISNAYHIWNYLDEFGLLVDLERLHLENNVNYRKRILDVYRNRPGLGVESFKLALRRELDLWRSEGATPDSDYEGATPEVLEISDLEVDPNYMTPRGLPTERFVGLVEQLAKDYPTTWGRFYWGRAYWDVAGENYSGYGTLPTQMDATPLTGDMAEYGVGDNNDLYLYRPDDFTGPHQFAVKLSARGRHRDVIPNSRPKVRVGLSLTGYADVIEYQNPVEEQWVTVLVTSADEFFFYHQVKMSAASDVSMTNETTTPASYGKFEIFDSNGTLRQDIPWFDETGAPWDEVATPHTTHVSEVASIVAVLGKYNPITEGVTDLPSDDDVSFFFSTTALDENGNPEDFIAFGGDDLIYAEDPTAMPTLYMRSTSVAAGEGEWHSEPQFITVELNGNLDNTAQDFELQLPAFEWPWYLADTPNKRCLIQIYTTDEDSNYGGFTTDAEDQPVFLDTDYFEVDGDNTWPEDGRGIFVDYPPDSTDMQVLISDSFDRPDADWLGVTDPTGPDGFPISGGVGWIDVSALIPDQPVAPLGVADGSTAVDTELYPDAETFLGALLTDVRDGYAGGSFSDPAQLSIRASVSVGSVDDGGLSSAAFAVRAHIDGDEFSAIQVAFTDTVAAVLVVHSDESATPDIYTSDEYDYGSGDLDVRVDVIGDVIGVYVEGDLVLAYSYPEEYWNNKYVAIATGPEGVIHNFELRGQTTKEFDPQTVTISTVDGADYPLDSWGWEVFENEYEGNYIPGIVDENGPWRNDVQPMVPSSTFIWKILDLSRDDFGIPNSDDYVVTWIGVKTSYGARSVLTWLDSNVVAPAVGAGSMVYPETAIQEIYDEDIDKYGYEPLIIKARLRPEPDTHWYPQMNAGYYYLGDEERYAYANRKDEQINPATPVLSGVPRMGAPIMVYTTKSQLLTSDSFNRPDDSDIGFTDGDGLYDPAEWNAGGFQIKDNMALAAADGLAYATQDFSVDDVEVTVALGPGAETIPLLLVVRGDEVGNGYAVRVLKALEPATPSSDPFEGAGYYVSVGLDSTNDFTGLGGVYVAHRPNTVKVTAIGDVISIYVDGALVLSLQDDTYSTGLIGFLAIEGGTTYDSIEVRELNETATPTEYRQVSFVDPESLDLTLENTELIRGNTTDTLYLAYEDVYDVSVENLTTGEDVTLDVSSPTNEIQVSEATSTNHTYEVRYRVANSFLVRLTDAPQSATLELDSLPDDDLVVSYEESIYNPAQILDLPLNPLHTRIEEGFVFISENEYDLDRIEVTYAPQNIIADGNDYIIFNVKSLDRYGNPKPYQVFTVESDWGVTSLPSSSLVTNNEGFAQFILRSSTDLPGETATPGPLVGTVTFSGHVDLEVQFDIQPVLERLNRLTAVPSAEEVPADGLGSVVVYGKLTTADLEPIAGEEIVFRKARTLYEAFTSEVVEASVVTNDEGEFEIGPFQVASPDAPGLWFVVVETEDQECGDVVFWREYPMAAFGIDDMTGLPVSDIQMATPISDIPPYAYGYKFPYSYDEDVELPATPTSVEWLPPRWFMLEWFLQYQLGIIADTRHSLSPGYQDEVHGPYRL